MKGVILAGGYGARLMPLTKITNKHLVPVWNKPMIYYPLQTLIDAGIKDIIIITGPEYAGDFLRLLGSGKDFGVKLTFRLQDEAGGIAQALSMTEDFVGREKFIVILGDNIFEDNMGQAVREFEGSDEEAKIFLKEVPDAVRFGVAEIAGNRIVSIVEKPKEPKSNYAVVGLYMYSPGVFDIIRTLKPSQRGEFEQTDVNNEYVRRGKMSFSILVGFWSDAGTFPSLHRATEWIKSMEDAAVNPPVK